jgi:hypothetical protein
MYMSMRKKIGKLTSPLFVPLRKMVVWSDKKIGTCDMKLTLEPRTQSDLDGFADMDNSVETISELQKKISKDKANMVGLGEKDLMCYFCRGQLIWENDNRFEDYGISGEGQVVSLKCSKCPATFEGFLREWPLDDEEE